MAYPIDPQLEKIKLLVKYAETKEQELRPQVISIIEESSVLCEDVPLLSQGSFETAKEAEKAIIEAGAATANLGFTGSVFGNVSVRVGDELFISATGSHLADLTDEIVRCDLTGRALNGKAPSSELPSHLRIATETSARCVLHAHPFFSVAMSLVKGIGSTAFGVPVTGGKIGGGEEGIVNTVPPLLKKFNIAIVWGHGVFAADAFDFNNPLKSIHRLEKLCRKRFIEEYLGL